MTTPEVQINPILAANLYRQETYVDDTSGTILRRIPVTDTGERDHTRMEIFGASCVLNVNGQPMPVAFDIQGATSLADAMQKFPDALRNHIQVMRENALRNKILSGGGKGNGLGPGIDLSRVRSPKN